jgi:hypothetical protein
LNGNQVRRGACRIIACYFGCAESGRVHYKRCVGQCGYACRIIACYLAAQRVVESITRGVWVSVVTLCNRETNCTQLDVVTLTLESGVLLQKLLVTELVKFPTFLLLCLQRPGNRSYPGPD